MILSEENPFAWDRCTHEGIGQLGCSVCDPDKSRCLRRARYEAYLEVAAEREACAKVAQHHTDCTLARNIAAAIRARGSK